MTKLVQEIATYHMQCCSQFVAVEVSAAVLIMFPENRLSHVHHFTGAASSHTFAPAKLRTQRLVAHSNALNETTLCPGKVTPVYIFITLSISVGF